MRLRRLLLLFFGHMTSDMYPGMLSPLLPLILERYGLSMATAGVLIMVLQGFCNLSQPFVGFLNDHHPMKSFLWLGLLVSAIPFCFILKFGRIDYMVVALAVSGLGVGMYHPVAVVAAGLIAREKHSGVTMALFSSGGSFGFMIAPLVVVLVVEVLGEQYMPIVLLPALAMTFFFTMERGFVVNDSHHLTIREWFSALSESRRELFILWMVASFRAIVSLNVGSFLPILAMARGASYVASAYFLTGTLFAAMIGMFVGGHLSDVHGRRKVMAITLLVSSPLLYIFLYTSGIFSIAALMLGMGALASTIPVNIYLAQRVAPRHAAVASSFVMGLPFAMAALVAPPFGALADRIGIEAAMNVMFFIPALGGIAVFFLRHEG